MSRIQRPPESIPDIVAEALRKSDRKIYAEAHLAAAIGEVLESIGSSHRPREVLGKLRDAGAVTEIVLKSPDYAPIRRYAVGAPSPFELGLSLRGGAYLSHASAVFLLGLSALT
mgnify:CR=1 FL=1